MKELKLEADSYKKEGYQEFSPSYETYMKLLKKYENYGYSKAMLDKLDVYFNTQEQIFVKKEQDIRKKIRIGKRLEEALQVKKKREEKEVLYNREVGIRKE